MFSKECSFERKDFADWESETVHWLCACLGLRNPRSPSRWCGGGAVGRTVSTGSCLYSTGVENHSATQPSLEAICIRLSGSFWFN